MDRVELARLLGAHGLAVEQKDGWLRLHAQSGRQRGMALSALLVGLAFIGSGWLLPAHYLPEAQFAVAAIRAAFVCFGVSLVVVAAYLPFSAVEVRISRRKMVRVRTWLGRVIRRREIDLEDLEDLEIGRTAPAAGSPISICYELVGRGSFGRLKLLESIPDRSLVEAVRTQVMVAAGLRPSPTH